MHSNRELNFRGYIHLHVCHVQYVLCVSQRVLLRYMSIDDHLPKACCNAQTFKICMLSSQHACMQIAEQRSDVCNSHNCNTAIVVDHQAICVTRCVS